MSAAETKAISVGFIGLGNMGLPIATNLLKAGYHLRVYNRSAEKAAPLVEGGAMLARSPSEAVDRGGVVFTMLSDDTAVNSIADSNPAFLERFGGSGIHVSMSTIAPQTARELAEHHAKKGVSYLAAPVMGRPDRAATGSLFILLAGERDRFLSALAKGRGDLDWAGLALGASEDAGLTISFSRQP